MSRTRVAIVVIVSALAASFVCAEPPQAKNLAAAVAPIPPCTVVAAPLVASPREYKGKCPTVIRFKGSIQVKGRVGPNNPCVVKYVFDRSDGATDTIVKSLTFTAPGSKGVATTWTLGGAELPHYAGWEAIRTLSPPPEKQWGHAGFEIWCRVPPQPVVKIVGIDCAKGLAVNVHILIDSPAGIGSYKVWSVFTGDTGGEQTFTPPLPTHIDRVVTIAHIEPDNVDRDHQWGLKVMVPGIADPLFAYGWEPQGPDGRKRCPGHYLAPPAVKP
jgi:hypothetical protein